MKPAILKRSSRQLRRVDADLRACLGGYMASSPPVNAAFRRRTEISAAAWATSTVKSIWPVRRLRQPVPFSVRLPLPRRYDKMVLEGKVWRYGDNIDTDVIIPARYLNSFDPKELATHCMVDIDETFAGNVRQGTSWSAATTLAAVHPVNTHRLPSRRRASPSSLRPASPASSTAMPSTSACRPWKSATTSKNQAGDILSIDLTTRGKSSTRDRRYLPGTAPAGLHPGHRQSRRLDQLRKGV